VTYASHRGQDDRFCRAVESAIRNDVKLVILGWNVKWIGLSQKLDAAYSYAKSLPESDIILFTDAFDVLFCDNTETIKRKFINLSQSFNASIIFSAECGCWPHVMEEIDAVNHGKPSKQTTCFIKYPISPTPYRYLNSGMWIGYAKKSAAMLKEVIIRAGHNFATANDQELVANMYIDGKFGL
jgi:hypothetical protein